jgi:hypothetical protein
MFTELDGRNISTRHDIVSWCPLGGRYQDSVWQLQCRKIFVTTMVESKSATHNHLKTESHHIRIDVDCLDEGAALKSIPGEIGVVSHAKLPPISAPDLISA